MKNEIKYDTDYIPSYSNRSLIEVKKVLGDKFEQFDMVRICEKCGHITKK